MAAPAHAQSSFEVGMWVEVSGLVKKGGDWRREVLCRGRLTWAGGLSGFTGGVVRHMDHARGCYIKSSHLDIRVYRPKFSVGREGVFYSRHENQDCRGKITEVAENHLLIGATKYSPKGCVITHHALIGYKFTSEIEGFLEEEELFVE